MRRQQAEQLGAILNQFLREEGLETPYNEWRLIQAWPEVMGQGIARYTLSTEIHNRTLFVRLSSSVVRHELMSGRKALVHRLNNYIGAQVIDNIVFR
ncbi:MAG: DUF721 domain-containing protein [Bacteroidaceae bacterium]|jgi:hypothetical protein|nr:DUF721 domain-containing protein [Bacteroidaceae bacterium]